MAMDARVRYTKMVIRESCIQLMAKKPFHQITVKDICDLAGINRSTFYRNYSDIYELREQIKDEMMQKARDMILSRSLDNVEKTLLSILTAMKENQSRYVGLHNIHKDNMIVDIIEASFQDNKERLLKMGAHLSETEIRWYFKYISTGCATIMVDWVEHGMKEPPEEVARFAAALVDADTMTVGLK